MGYYGGGGSGSSDYSSGDSGGDGGGDGGIGSGFGGGSGDPSTGDGSAADASQASAGDFGGASDTGQGFDAGAGPTDGAPSDTGGAGPSDSGGGFGGAGDAGGSGGGGGAGTATDTGGTDGAPADTGVSADRGADTSGLGGPIQSDEFGRAFTGTPVGPDQTLGGDTASRTTSLGGDIGAATSVPVARGFAAGGGGAFTGAPGSVSDILNVSQGDILAQSQDLVSPPQLYPAGTVGAAIPGAAPLPVADPRYMQDPQSDYLSPTRRNMALSLPSDRVNALGQEVVGEITGPNASPTALRTDQSAIQANLEETFNRAQSYLSGNRPFPGSSDVTAGGALSYAISDPTQDPKTIARVNQGAPISGAENAAFLGPMENVLAGSNLTNYATGNASIDPATGKYVGFGGPGGYQTYSASVAGQPPEHFGVEQADLPFARMFANANPQADPRLATGYDFYSSGTSTVPSQVAPIPADVTPLAPDALAPTLDLPAYNAPMRGVPIGPGTDTLDLPTYNAPMRDVPIGAPSGPSFAPLTGPAPGEPSFADPFAPRTTPPFKQPSVEEIQKAFDPQYGPTSADIPATKPVITETIPGPAPGMPGTVAPEAPTAPTAPEATPGTQPEAPTTPGLPPGPGPTSPSAPPAGPADAIQIAGPEPVQREPIPRGGFERGPPPSSFQQGGGGGLPPAPQVVNAMLSNAAPAVQQAAASLSPVQQNAVSQFAFQQINQFRQLLLSQGGTADPSSPEWQQQILPQIRQNTQQFVLQLTGRQNPQAVQQALAAA